MSAVNTDFSSGFSDVLPPSLQHIMPEAEDLIRPQAAHEKTGHSEALSKQICSLSSLAAEHFAPTVSNPDLLRSDVLHNALSECATELSDISDEEVQSFLKEDLQPLLQNIELLNFFRNMMVTG